MRAARAIVTVLALVLVTLALRPATGPAGAAPAAAPETLRFSAFLVGVDGGPVRGAEVELATLRRTARGASTRPVDVAITDDSGWFEVALPLAGAPRDSAGGIIAELVYHAAPGEPGLVYDIGFWRGAAGGFELMPLPGALVRQSGPAPGGRVDYYLGLGRGAVSDRRLLTPLVPGPTARVDGVGALRRLGATPRAAGQPAEVIEGGPVTAACPEDYPCYADMTSCFAGDTLGWEFLAHARKRHAYVPTKYLHGPHNGTMIWSWTRSRETTLTAALKVGASKYPSGAFGASHRQVSDESFQGRAKDGSSKYFYQLWEYRKQRGLCHGQTGALYWIGLWKYVPYRLDDSLQSRQQRTSYTFKCRQRNRSTFGFKTTVTRKTRMTFYASFSLWGVSLSDAQFTNNTEQRFIVKPDIDANTVLCGYDARPVKAITVRALT